ncbi:MAG: hypothetical protein H0U77_05005 [Nocardioidaceae bacterium]|nr:hypothetical protein [Nocardioidaceae bacterium]
MAADIAFYFDPVCPFCWMTSKWVRLVSAQRDYQVDWRFISLRLLNAHIDYDEHFPPEYEAGHAAGLRLLRVVAKTRVEHGGDAVGALYEALGAAIHEVRSDADVGHPGTREFLAPILVEAKLPTELADALDDDSVDPLIQAETDEALSLTGKDVGTPIICFDPPDGISFFGPVISRPPSKEEALELWDHVVGLARFPGFSELKRSMRERPQLASAGIEQGDVGIQEDWHAGSRRQKR